MPPETPFAEDFLVCQLAESLGLSLSRFDAVEIYDETALAAAGLMRSSPDYSRIRKAIQQGHTVQGARAGLGVRYTLERRGP